MEGNLDGNPELGGSSSFLHYRHLSINNGFMLRRNVLKKNGIYRDSILVVASLIYFLSFLGFSLRSNEEITQHRSL
jgi:hypothetical protein